VKESEIILTSLLDFNTIPTS
jgi:antitoxin PrlF